MQRNCLRWLRNLPLLSLVAAPLATGGCLFSKLDLDGGYEDSDTKGGPRGEDGGFEEGGAGETGAPEVPPTPPAPQPEVPPVPPPEESGDDGQAEWGGEDDGGDPPFPPPPEESGDDGQAEWGGEDDGGDLPLPPPSEGGEDGQAEWGGEDGFPGEGGEWGGEDGFPGEGGEWGGEDGGFPGETGGTEWGGEDGGFPGENSSKPLSKPLILIEKQFNRCLDSGKAQAYCEKQLDLALKQL